METNDLETSNEGFRFELKRACEKERPLVPLMSTSYSNSYRSIQTHSSVRLFFKEKGKIVEREQER